jgi:vacuolar-type H+-ATPase subunit I/STV1
VTAPPDPVADWLARLAAAQPAEVLQRLTNVEAQLTVQAIALAALAQANNQLKESLMATAEEFATRLDNATNEIAADLQSLRDQLQAVRDEIPAAQQAAVDTALAQLDAPLAREQARGQDPPNPVPEPTPEPAPAPEPAPGEPTA